MLKVLHVFGRMMRAGAELRTVELMPHLATRNVHVDFCTLTPEPGELDERIRQLGGEVYPCRLGRVPWKFGRRFRHLLSEGHYDVVHSHVHYTSGYMVRLAHVAGVRGRVVHFRTTSDGRESGPARKAYRTIMRRMIDKHATAIVAVSRSAMDAAWGSNWSNDTRAQVIYNGLDLTQFNRNGSNDGSLIRELSLPVDAHLALCVARFEPNKRHSMLVSAFALALANDQRLHLLLAGDGPLRPAIENQARTLGVQKNVHLLGARDDVPRLLEACSLVILASRREGLPGVVLEALAANVPVVATDLPVVREIMEHTNLIRTFPIDSTEGLADSIREAIADHIAQPESQSDFPAIFDIRSCASAVHNMYVHATGEHE